MSLTAEEIREFTMIALDQPPFWPQMDDSFRFTVTVDGTNNRPLTVSFPGGAYYSILNGFGGTINWGDGITEEVLEFQFFSETSHTYSSSGTYQIKIKGHFEYSMYTDGSMVQYNHRLLVNPLQLDSIDSKFPIPEYAYRYSKEGEIHYEWRPISSASPRYNTIYIDGLFSSCSNLKRVPLGLFKNIPNENFGKSSRRLFNGCLLLQEIPYDLFSYFDKVIGLAEYIFTDCTSITNIPKNIFNNFTDVTSFNRCFDGCSSLKSIPSGLFDNCPNVTNFMGCFWDCNSLEIIPDGLFDNTPLVTTFENTFSDCSSLLSIPSGLFDNCPNVTSFNESFISCTSLKSIPSGLFDNCSKVTNFSFCFRACTSLTSIPSGLFDNCSNVTNFSSCFGSCTSLTSIPSGLFDNCSKVTTFQACFGSCTSLTSIPSGLFNNCVSANDFRSCFRSCSGITSAVPELWITHSSSRHTECYYNCINAYNWEDIPYDWKNMSWP